MPSEGLIGGQSLGSGATPSVSLSPAALTNGGLVVQVIVFDSNNATTVDAVSWNGSALTQEGTQVNNDWLSNRRLAISTWVLINPDADGSSYNLAITLSETVVDAAVVYWFLNDCDQTDFASNHTPATDTGGADDTPTVDLTSANADAWLVGTAALVGGGSGGGYWTPGTGVTEKVDDATGINASADFRYTGIYREEASTGTYTLESTANSAGQWVIAAIEVKPAGGAPPAGATPYYYQQLIGQV